MTKHELGDLIIAFTDDFYRIAKAILKEDADCEDAMSSAIVKGFTKIHTLRQKEYAKTWFPAKVSASGESTYIDDDGNYCFHTNILLPALTQDFTSLEVTPYLHLEDGTETDLDFASFRVDYK